MAPRLRPRAGVKGPSCLSPPQPLFLFCLYQVDKAASGLLSLGLRKGDRLGMWGPNSYAWVLIQLATAQAGIILVRRGLPGPTGCVEGRHSRGASYIQNQTSVCLASGLVVLPCPF